MNAYILLLIAIIAEVIGSIALRLSVGFTKLLPSIAVITGYGVALVLLSIATKTIPLSISYTMWAGLGTAGAVAAGILVFNENVSLGQFIGIGLIVIGVFLLNYFKTPATG